jgi:hypothetical protein
MKQLSKIILLASGFGLVLVAFFSMHNRTVKAQSITNANTQNTQITLLCDTTESVPSAYGDVACMSWYQIQPGGGVPGFVIPSGQTLIITDMECTTVGKGGEYGTCTLHNQANANCSSFKCEITPLAQAGTIAGPGGTSVIGLHMTTGIQFTALPGMVITGSPELMTMQGYLIPTPGS